MKKRVVALMLIASMGITSCANNAPTETTTEITAEVLSETRQTEETDSYVEYEEAVIMYAKKDGVIRDTASQTGVEVGTLEVGGEYTVVGEDGGYLAISYMDTVCFVERGCLTTHQVPVPTESSEMTEETTVESSEETSETEESSEETTVSVAETTASGGSSGGSSSSGNSGSSNSDSGSGGGSAPSPTETQYIPEETTPPQAVETHDINWWMSNQGISSYTTTDGVTVYGYYSDTSGLDAAVNDYRASLGYAPYTIGDNGACREAARNSYSQSAPYWHSSSSGVVSNLTTSSDAYGAFYNSANHRGNWESPCTSGDYYIVMSSATFNFYEYGGDDVGFTYSRCVTVQNFETVWQY